MEEIWFEVKISPIPLGGMACLGDNGERDGVGKAAWASRGGQAARVTRIAGRQGSKSAATMEGGGAGKH